MSVPAYIAGDSIGLRMPRVDRDGRDKMGIRFSGAVLTGDKQMERELREAGWPVPVSSNRMNRYRTVAEYDAVLQCHCRLR